MPRLMVRYKVRPDQAAANVQAIESVFTELWEQSPPGVRYATFTLDDGVTFVHLFSGETEHDRAALQALPAFKAFSSAVRDRCEEQPVVTPLNDVGSYRMFGEASPSEPFVR
ncbi:MAG TPA: hypothetical protein VM076_06590 [Gemmatimonadaceae bacterium]|nr:hypothetical protein [Gemmatimonadaceae bacterium]